MYVIGNGSNNVSVVDKDGTIIETFESSGCVYNDLGCCQGCPTCMFENDYDYEDETEEEE